MSLPIDLVGQVAWVTGGAGDIGAAIVTMLGRGGARVVSIDRSFEGMQTDQPGVVRVGADVTDSDAVNRMAGELVARGLAPDVLVNNAGIARDAIVWKMSDEQWHDVLDVNLGGAFRLVRACCPAMRQKQGGVIVNVASINGIRGKVGQSNYSASKAGLIGLTKTLARELGGSGIRVNAVAPGMVDTAMTRDLPADVRARAALESLLGRLGRVEDVAGAVLFLASPPAADITGHVLVVDGGQIT